MLIRRNGLIVSDLARSCPLKLLAADARAARAAKMLGVAPAVVREWVRTGKLLAVQIDGTVLLDAESVRENSV